MNAIRLTIGALLIGVAHGQSSCLQPSYAAPSVASGYVAQLVATGFSYPRGIKFDTEGALLVVESGTGITALNLEYSHDGCISESSRKTVIDDKTLNHGIELSKDGTTLYASNTESARGWGYSPKTQKTTSGPTTLVKNMTNGDHVTRTLLLPRSNPGMLIVSRGSTSNVDPLADDIYTGHSQIKAFDLTNMTGPYDFDKDGLLLGWGLRNDVGVDEEPTKGGIYAVENSVDQLTRNGVDIHNTNPAEELNFLGYLDGKASSNQGANFGYPKCFTAWDVDTIPKFNGVVGQQFAIGSSSKDSECSNKIDPRISFHPHMAPLDILFNDDGTEAWVSILIDAGLT